MTIREALNLSTKKLKKNTSPYLDAEVLLCYVLNKTKEQLFTDSGFRIPDQQAKRFKQLVNKRAKGWPVAYLTGEKEFFGLKFLVNKNVLIPRPETESLVELILKALSGKGKRVRILDVGTGSGCIIISLARTSLNSQVFKGVFYASDISLAALKVARKNAKRHKTKIIFKQGDLLKPWKNHRFDIIVANLPYLPRLEDPSTKFEPKKALIAKKHGLALIEKLFDQIRKSVFIHTSVKYIFLEFDPRQSIQIKNLAHKYLPGFKTKIYKDLAGRNRFAKIYLN